MNHYYTDNTNTKSDPWEIVVFLEDKKFIFMVDHGVFSPKKLDFGSRLLITSIIDKIHGKCLDIGCGYGPIGIILNKLTKCKFDMIDVNRRAVDLANKNIEKNSANCRAFFSDSIEEIEGLYENIICNPPIRAGKKIIFSIYQQAYEKLVHGGSLFIVIQKKQGMKSSVAKLKEIFDEVVTLEKKKGYHVICAKKP